MRVRSLPIDAARHQSRSPNFATEDAVEEGTNQLHNEAILRGYFLACLFKFEPSVVVLSAMPSYDHSNPKVRKSFSPFAFFFTIKISFITRIKNLATVLLPCGRSTAAAIAITSCNNM